MLGCVKSKLVDERRLKFSVDEETRNREYRSELIEEQRMENRMD
jgi:hypothetical protein